MKLIIYLFLFFASVNAFGQGNLVPNPSFEQYSSCPAAFGEVYKATGWNSFNTPDYFNTCATSTDVGVPLNYMGYQYAATGNAYGGFFTYYSSFDYHEFLYTQLQSPLIKNQKYFISFKVSPADSGFCIYSNKTGVKFFTNTPGSIVLNNTAHFYTNTIITDTAGWTKVSGSFVADSVYKYAVFGNFFNDANTDIIDHNCGFPLSYYYIDDICISTDSLLCNSIVPINLLSFNVKNLHNSLHLLWRTAQEINNKGFDILRSEADANHFQKIGFVNGAGYSTTERNYSFTDNNLRRNTEYFYKLRQIDFDGKFSYSPIQKGKVQYSDAFNFFVTPNPVLNELRVHFKDPIDGPCQVKIVDNLGKVLFTKTFFHLPTGQSLNMSLQSLPRGIYFVQVTGNLNTGMLKVIKN